MTGLLTRRRIAASVGAVTMFLAACGGTTSSPTPSGGSPVNGGNLKLGVWQAQTSFLNAGVVDSQTFSYLIDAPSAEGLLWYRSGNETKTAKTLADYWQPWLATEVPTTANGDVKTTGCPDTTAAMCVDWKLRTDVTWQDGHAFNAHDVCDTFQEYWLKYGNNNPTPLLSKSGWDHTSKCIESTDEHTATVEFSKTYGPYLTLGSGAMGILPSTILDQAFTDNKSIEAEKYNIDLTKGSNNPLAYKAPSGGASADVFVDGTGPYVLKSFDPNTGVVYTANKNYWNKDHQPHLDSVNFVYEADLNSEVTAISTGAVQGAFDMRLFNLKSLLKQQSAGKVAVQAVPDSGAEKIDLNVCDDQTFWVGGKSLCGTAYKHSPYLAVADIRHAIAMAINRPKIVTEETDNNTSVPKDSFLYLGAEYLDDPSIPSTAYDPTGANNLLDKDGYKKAPQCNGGLGRAFSDGSCITLTIGTTSGNTSREAVEPLVEADLAAIGIKVSEPYNNAKSGVFFGSFSDGGTLYTHNFDMGMYTNTLSAPAEPDAFYTGYVGCYDAATSTSPTTLAGCSGAHANNNNVPSNLNGGNGQDDTGINDPTISAAMEKARDSVDLTQRTANYVTAEKALAADLPEIPLYRQVTVDAFTPSVQGVLPNDIVWDYNLYDWFCTAGKC